MGIRFSPGCECCGNILFWFNSRTGLQNLDSYVTGIPFGNVYGYYTGQRQLIVHTAISDFSGNAVATGIGYPADAGYSGDISNYKLVFWICPMRDTIPVWWQTVYNGGFSGRIVIVTEYSFYADNPLQDFFYSHADYNYFNSIFGPIIGLKYIPKVISTPTGLTQGDKLTNGMGTFINFGVTGAIDVSAGAITVAKLEDNVGAGGFFPVIARNYINQQSVEFVLSGDSNVFVYNFAPDLTKNAFLDNLWDAPL